MPPAFVLSQDQTLKFIPDLRKSSCLPKGSPMIRAAKRSLRCTNIRAALSRRPRIPSLFSTISNNNPRRGSDQKRHTPPRGRADRPTSPPASTPDSHPAPTNRPADPNLALSETRFTPPTRHVTQHSRGRARAQPRKGRQRSQIRTQLPLVQSEATKIYQTPLPQAKPARTSGKTPQNNGPTLPRPEVPNTKPMQSAKRAQTASAP